MCSHSRTVVLCVVVNILGGCACSNDEPSEQCSTRDNVLEEFKVSPEGLYLLLPVEIEGKEYPFIIDTGSTVTVYDASLRSFLAQSNQPFGLHTPDGEMLLTSYFSPIARLGHFSLPTMFPVLCLDLGRFRELCGAKLYGCLGMDFLRESILQIDFDRCLVTFLRSASSALGVRIPVRFQNGVPQVQVKITGLATQQPFRIDTGYLGIGDGALHASVFDTLVEGGNLKLGDQVRSETLSGSRINRFGNVLEMFLGKFYHKELLFSRSPKVNSLGINYWSRYIVTFDFPHSVIYLKRGCQYDRKEKGSGERKGKKRGRDS